MKQLTLRSLIRISLVISLGILLILPQSAWSAAIVFQGKIFGGLSHSSFDLDSDRRANFGGTRAGGELGGAVFNGNYGFGGSLGYRTGSSTNSANNSDTSETATNSSTYLSGKAYAAAAFLQVGVVAITNQITLKNGATTTKTNYSGNGLFLSLGADAQFGSGFFISPSIYYENVVMTQKDASAAPRRYQEGGLLVGLGLSF